MPRAAISNILLGNLWRILQRLAPGPGLPHVMSTSSVEILNAQPLAIEAQGARDVYRLRRSSRPLTMELIISDAQTKRKKGEVWCRTVLPRIKIRRGQGEPLL
ncbi:hypothetical protein CY34DRAFT_809658 [Suillus luteus UH-Slu-Lm8-n1]|uniref:Uncharacterized protein n=1 Tax=Suillus luteus UH-Slu-Lm8-n1 TaxID=930992 RepID=A0A0D0A8W8_9AGAM|nr:hypothetical protein CY34DRAFT_809658 [Suillus luteus UH-Slu-Lm8-n1]